VSSRIAARLHVLRLARHLAEAGLGAEAVVMN